MKVINKYNRTIFEACLSLRTKTSEQAGRKRSGVFFQLWTNFTFCTRDVFRTQLNIEDGTFCKNIFTKSAILDVRLASKYLMFTVYYWWSLSCFAYRKQNRFSENDDFVPSISGNLKMVLLVLCVWSYQASR